MSRPQQPRWDDFPDPEAGLDQVAGTGGLRWLLGGSVAMAAIAIAGRGCAAFEVDELVIPMLLALVATCCAVGWGMVREFAFGRRAEVWIPVGVSAWFVGFASFGDQLRRCMDASP